MGAAQEETADTNQAQHVGCSQAQEPAGKQVATTSTGRWETLSKWWHRESQLSAFGLIFCQKAMTERQQKKSTTGIVM